MREMIISELSQALHDIARSFAHFLPRLIVMLILAVLGWVIAYVIKAVLRSTLRLLNFDKTLALLNYSAKPRCLQRQKC
jgi:endonuclease/exonuclease/phosphatase (EEP) superfamily protein YafD